MLTDRILRLPDVIATTGLRRTAIYDAIRRGTFPAPLALTDRARGWKISDIRAWIDSRESAR